MHVVPQCSTIGGSGMQEWGYEHPLAWPPPSALPHPSTPPTIPEGRGRLPTPWTLPWAMGQALPLLCPAHQRPYPGPKGEGPGPSLLGSGSCFVQNQGGSDPLLLGQWDPLTNPRAAARGHTIAISFWNENGEPAQGGPGTGA